MNRHVLGLSQNKIVKRGFILISAFMIVIGLNIKPVWAYVPQGSLQISYVNFYSMRNINPSTGTDLTNNEDWIVLDFNFDGYFSGTVDMTLTFTKPVLSDPEHTAIGANAYRLSSTTTGNTSNVQQTDRWLFKFENTQHFQFIYHLESSGGIYFGGNFGTITVDVTHSEDGSSVPSVSIDYTDILTDILGYTENIYTDLDTLAQNVDLIRTTSAGIANTLIDIKTALGDFKNWLIYHDMPEYQKMAVRQFIQFGYTWNYTNTNALRWGWDLVQPSTLSTANGIYLTSVVESYTLVYLSNAASQGVFTFTGQDNTVIQVTSQRKYSANTQGSYHVLVIDKPKAQWYKLTSVTNAQFIQPIYFGNTDSLPQEIAVLTYEKSVIGWLKEIVGLFNQNNQQNNEVLQSLEGINQNQQTISQNITDFNNDFNTALQNVPLSDVTQQLQNMQSTFQMQSNLWSQIWEALGKLRLVFILLLIVLLMKMFVGRDK